MNFEWHAKKREINLERHGVDFVLAVRIFEGFVLQRQDTRKDYGEIRILAIGQVEDLVLTVVFTPRKAAIRMISARRASRDEARAYRELRPQTP